MNIFDFIRKNQSSKKNSKSLTIDRDELSSALNVAQTDKVDFSTYCKTQNGINEHANNLSNGFARVGVSALELKVYGVAAMPKKQAYIRCEYCRQDIAEYHEKCPNCGAGLNRKSICFDAEGISSTGMLPALYADGEYDYDGEKWVKRIPNFAHEIPSPDCTHTIPYVPPNRYT